MCSPVSSRVAFSARYFVPTGVQSLIQRLTQSDETYAITSGYAASLYAPLAASSDCTIWIRNAADAARRLSLLEPEAMPNVTLLEPRDESVFAGKLRIESATLVAPSQVAADLLTSEGRAPAKGEVLIQWMRVNEASWRK
jgi:hypothetical protein